MSPDSWWGPHKRVTLSGDVQESVAQLNIDLLAGHINMQYA